MKFGARPVAASKGCILAHSVPLPEGGRLAKGTLLGAAEIAALTMAGRQEVVVAELDPLDVGEAEAARRLAEALVPFPDEAGLRLTKAHAGRVNLVATGPGIVGLDAAAVTEANQVSEALTIATLPQYQRVSAGDLVATIKVIPFAVSRSALSQAVELAYEAIRIRPVLARRASLIQTVIGGDASGTKGEAVTRDRLARLGMTLRESILVPHREPELAEALLGAEGDIVLILTASATVDRADVAPAAVVAAGGEVTRFGIPVDPGNLLFAGVLGATPIIGLPGCARAPQLNGADWVLERLVCGVPIMDADVAAMGVGGLLKDVVARGAPRRSEE